MSQLIKGRRVLILPMSADSPALFEEIFAVTDLQAARQAFEMARLFQGAVESNGHFSLNNATQIARQQPNMQIVQPLDTTLGQNHDRVSEMINRVVGVLSNFLNMAIPPKQYEQLRASITYAFVNLNGQRTDGWIFYEKESKWSTTYQYNILYAVQNPSTGAFIYGIPMGMTIKVNREYERVLFITIKDEVSYTVRIEALKVLEPLTSAIQTRARMYLRQEALALPQERTPHTVQ